MRRKGYVSEAKADQLRAEIAWDQMAAWIGRGNSKFEPWLGLLRGTRSGRRKLDGLGVKAR